MKLRHTEDGENLFAKTPLLIVLGDGLEGDMLLDNLFLLWCKRKLSLAKRIWSLAFPLRGRLGSEPKNRLRVAIVHEAGDKVCFL